MTQIIRLKQATGAQLQQAARHAQLIETPNMPYGFGNAYYAAVPSPMQEQILRKGLQSAGINYLKVEECVTAASEADRFPKELKEGMKQLLKAVKSSYAIDTSTEIRVAGQILYARVWGDSGNPLLAARTAVKGKGFTQQNGRTWTKAVHLKRKSFVASVEVIDNFIQLSVFKGA